MPNTAFITGAAQRVGKAVAEHLASHGWNIAIHYNRSSSDAENLAKQLGEKYPRQKFATFGANLMNDSQTENLIRQVIAEMGRLDLLINNASVFDPGTIRETSPSFFDEQFGVNLRAPFILTRQFALNCSEGLIINFTDTRITNNSNGFAAYSLAKKALWELTKMAAFELGPDFRVNAIAPGLTLPPADKDEEYLNKLAKKIPMKRAGGLEPILKSIDFILENDYLTGQILFCDGGENLGKTV
jgi:NAD(P)-dependent dehydrogenase (short-subunit alcohol dehydrogenase family)